MSFWGFERGGELLGVMGVQDAGDVDLIRHAYVSPGSQRSGMGSALLEHLLQSAARTILVGTWAAAEWAIRFYERHGVQPCAAERTAELLNAYWEIPDRQIETSVVLSREPGRTHAARLTSSGYAVALACSSASTRPFALRPGRPRA